MSNILRNPIPEVTTTSAGLAAGLGVTPLPFINAATVIDEVIKRCGNGMQYTTFPNQITPLEEAKLTAAGYFVTANTVSSDVRHGAEDLYIGFQVALNETAVSASMQMLPNTSSEGE